MKTTKTGKKQYRKRRQYKKRVVRRRRLDVRDVAGVTVTQNSFGISANTMYTLRNFSLSNNVRASTVSQGYQFYRIKSVSIKWIPYFDTFQPGTSAGYGVPQLYYMVDKAGLIPSNADLNTLKKMGAKPIRFDDKNITRSFKPAILIDSNDNGTGPAPVIAYSGALKVSPWLPTNANAGNQVPFAVNSVDHRGMSFYVQAQAFNLAQVGEIEITINYEFKKPLWVSPSSVEEATVIDLDTLGKDPEPPVEKPPVEEPVPE